MFGGDFVADLAAMDEDESLSTLLAMGFPDIGEIKRALRLAKNDLSEAVAILTNEQPSNAVNNNDCRYVRFPGHFEVKCSHFFVLNPL